MPEEKLRDEPTFRCIKCDSFNSRVYRTENLTPLARKRWRVCVDCGWLEQTMQDLSRPAKKKT